MSPHTIGFGNLKGGVGKTSIVLAIAESLAESGKTVLVCDLDPQGSASIVLGAEIAEDQLTIYDILKGNIPGSIGQAIIETDWHENLDLVPADSTLAVFVDESLTAAEHRLKAAMSGAPALETYDYILFDFPPSLGRLTLNGLVAADTAVAVTTPESLSVNGLSEFLKTVEDARHPMLNSDLGMGGIILNNVDRRLNEHQFQLEQIQGNWGADVLEPIVPGRSAIKDMASAGVPILKTGNKNAKAIANMIGDLAAAVVGGTENG